MIKKKRYKFQVNLCLEELSEVTYRYNLHFMVLFLYTATVRINSGLVKVEIVLKSTIWFFTLKTIFLLC